MASKKRRPSSRGVKRPRKPAPKPKSKPKAKPKSPPRRPPPKKGKGKRPTRRAPVARTEKLRKKSRRNALARADYYFRAADAIAREAEKRWPGSIHAQRQRELADRVKMYQQAAHRSRTTSAKEADSAKEALEKARLYREKEAQADAKGAAWQPPRFLGAERFEVAGLKGTEAWEVSSTAFPEARNFRNANQVLGYLEGRPGVSQLLGFRRLSPTMVSEGKLTDTQRERAAKVAADLRMEEALLLDVLTEAELWGIELEVEIDY